MPGRLLVGDCRRTLAELPAGSAHCCVTSPPYFGLRDYGEAGQIGLEQSPAQYVASLVEVFRGVRRVLRPDGTLWLNLGDCYLGSGNASHDPGAGRGEAQERGGQRGHRRIRHLPDGNLLGIPWRVALALQADGWLLRSEVVWCLSGGTRVYVRTSEWERPVQLKDLVRMNPARVQLWNGQRWTQVLGWSKTPRPKKAFEVELRSGERIGCTGGHLWPTQRGNVRADELVAGDVVDTCRLPEPACPKNPVGLPDDLVGWFVGLYIAEGSMSGDTIQIASHVEEADRFAKLGEVARAFDGTLAVHNTGGSGCTANLHGSVLVGLLAAYVGGRTARDKHLHPRCWARSDQFLRAVLSGYLSGDGGYDEKNDRWRLGFCRNDLLASDLRTLGGRLGVSVRLKRCVHDFRGKKFPGWKGQLRWSPGNPFNSRQDGEVVAVRRSRARQFWDVGVADEPHLFALASGVLTHNSKPNPLPESVAGWRWERCRRKAAAVRQGRSQGYSAAGGHRDKRHGNLEDQPSVLWEDCPGCARCSSGHGLVLRRGSWRPTRSHEHVFLLAAGPGYYSSGEGVREAHTHYQARPGGHKRRRPGKGIEEHVWSGTARAEPGPDGDPAGRNLRDVWWVPTLPSRLGHYAMMSPEIADKCVRAGCPEACCAACLAPHAPVVRRGEPVSGPLSGPLPTCGCGAAAVPGTVLDPFLGAGTTAAVAEVLGRQWVGCELSPAYADLVSRRTEEVRVWHERRGMRRRAPHRAPPPSAERPSAERPSAERPSAERPSAEQGAQREMF